MFSIEEIAEMVRKAENAPRFVGSHTFCSNDHTYIWNTYSDGSFFIESTELFPRPKLSPEQHDKFKSVVDNLLKTIKDKKIKFILCQSSPISIVSKSDIH